MIARTNSRSPRSERRAIRSLVRALALGLAAGAIVSAPATAGAAASKNGAATLQRYAGTWVSDGQFLQTPYSRPAHVTGTTSCAWSPMRNSLVCDQVVRTRGGEQRDTALYAYDASSAQFRFAEFPFDGSPPHVTQLTIAGDTWSYVGGFGDAKSSVIFRTTDVFTGDSERWRIEYSLDVGKKWTQMGAGSAKRTGN